MQRAGLSFILAAGCLCCGIAAQEPPADPTTIILFLHDGRTIEGELDSQTDSSTLWVRREQNSIVLSSGFSWMEVDRVGRGQTVISSEQFRQQIQSLMKVPPAPQAIPLVEMAALVPQPLGSAPLVTSPRVRSLEIFAYPANWDSDVENDGLRVHVLPLDAQGRIAPIDAQFDCVLVGQDVRRSYVLDVQPRAFPELGRWSLRIRAEDFGEVGAIVELPFSSQHPEFDEHILPDGLLTARLGVSGQGVFDASDAWVLLRPPSVIRDALQLFTGRRTHPLENVQQRSQLYPTRTPNRRADDRAR